MAYTAVRGVLSPTCFLLIPPVYIHILNHYLYNDTKLKKSIKSYAIEDTLKRIKIKNYLCNSEKITEFNETANTFIILSIIYYWPQWKTLWKRFESEMHEESQSWQIFSICWGCGNIRRKITFLTFLCN